jgi:hypothetical protein
VLAHSMSGELTPGMAEAVAGVMKMLRIKMLGC